MVEIIIIIAILSIVMLQMTEAIEKNKVKNERRTDYSVKIGLHKYFSGFL